MPTVLKRLLVLLLLLCNLAFANADDVKKVVFHINNPAKVNYLAEGVSNLRRVSPNSDIVVVFNGRAVVTVSLMGQQENIVKELIGQGVKLGACTTAMLKLKMPADALIEGVEYIHEGGMLRLMKLQEQGYSYIKM